MMFCHKCGREFEGEAAFCGSCGTPYPGIESAEERVADPTETDMSTQVDGGNERPHDITHDKRRLGLILMGIAAGVCCLLLVLFLVIPTMKKADPIYLRMDELMADILNNQAHTEKMYGGKYICLTGFVNYISRDSITLESGQEGDYYVIFCYPKKVDDMVSLVTGEYISVWGFLQFGDAGWEMRRVTFSEPYLLVDGEPTQVSLIEDPPDSGNATPTISDYSIYCSPYGETHSPENYLDTGGPMVHLSIVGNSLAYEVSVASVACYRVADISGQAPLNGASEIHFYGTDGWYNIVSGTIYLLENGNVAVESEVLEYDPDALWALDISYTELVPCYSDYGSGDDDTWDSSDYLFPSDSQYITEWDLVDFTHNEIVLLRNEIYARYGYNFTDEQIQAYFNAQSWYWPAAGLDATTFSSSMFNDCERANIETILSYERDMGWRS